MEQKYEIYLTDRDGEDVLLAKRECVGRWLCALCDKDTECGLCDEVTAGHSSMITHIRYTHILLR